MALCRKSLLTLFIGSLMVSLTNCKEDEPAPASNLALTILTEGLSSTAEIFVTDQSGNVLESSIANGQMNFFIKDLPSPYYDLTIIDLLSLNQYSIKTYLKVPSASYFIKSSTQSTVAGLHRISFPNIMNYNHFNMQSEHLKDIIPISDTEFDLELTQSKSDVFLTLEKDASGVPSYFIQEQAEVGKTTLLDEVKLNQFNTMLSKTISSPQSLSDSYQYIIYGNINDSKRLLVSSYQGTNANNTDPVRLFYPSTSLFTHYTTEVNFDTQKENYTAAITQIQTTTLPAEPTDQLDVNLISYQELSANFQFELTGSAEWTHVQLQASQGDKSISWDVYLPFTHQNTLQIPGFLITYFMGKQFTFITNLKFSLIESSNDSATLDYEDFLILELKKDGTPTYIKNRYTTGYYLPQ